MGDVEPQPTDGPDYHAEHAAWQANRAEVRARAVMDFANLYLPTEYWYKARQHADNIRKGDA